ncbi:MAG: hypothetical protein AB7I38_11605 [Dehalococcoidia bacterium]
MPLDSLGSALVTFLARDPAATATLLAQHTDDGTGRCRVCSAGGQTGRYSWPCQIHQSARAAVANRGRRP